MIPFTQYLRPNGRRNEGGFDRPADIEALARELLDKGVHFDAEVLRTDALSLTAELDRLDEPVLAIEVFEQRSPEQVGERVDALVRRAHAAMALVEKGEWPPL